MNLNFLRGYRHKFRLYTRDMSNVYTLDGFHLRKCIFIHIPKTGGVHISRACFGSLGGGHNSLRDYERLLPDEIMSYNIFTVVRNPIKRFISAVNYFKGGGMSREDLKIKNTYIDKYNDINNLIEKELPLLSESINHFVPQIEYLSGSIPVMKRIKIYKYENFEEICNDLNAKYDINMDVTKKINAASTYFSYSDLSSSSLDILGRYYHTDILKYGYSFVT